ncbi:hypothetical protein BH23CHL2_BH23CHL2_11870 [soil metagenome]
MIDLSVEGMWTVLAPGELSGGRFAVVEARERRGAAPPRHVHSREDEFIYVLEGQLRVDLDGGRFDRAAGTGMFLPRGIEHSYRVQSEEARLLVLLSPAGLECCIAALVLSCTPDAEHQRIEHLVTIAARYGVAITAPARPP